MAPIDQAQIAAEWAGLYAGVAGRVTDLVIAGDCEAWLPACPGWRVHEMVAHMAGLCEDWVDERMFGYASDGWTAEQIDRFAGRTCPEILEAWAAAMGPFRELRDGMSGFPPGRWAFGDAVVHEADLRGALYVGRVPHDDVVRSVELLTLRWLSEVLRPAGCPDLLITAADAGSFGGGVESRVTVEPYELFRAMAGRRSAAQVRAWDWSGDPEPFVAAGLPYPFTWAADDLVD